MYDEPQGSKLLREEQIRAIALSLAVSTVPRAAEPVSVALRRAERFATYIETGKGSK